MPKANARTRPASRRLRGRGDYTDEIIKEPKPLLRLEKKIDHLERSLVHTTPKAGRAASMAGRALGSLVGQGDLGAFAGESLAKLFGHGDYMVKSNSLMSALSSSVALSGPQPPKFSSESRHIRVMEREFLGDISSGTLLAGSSIFTNSNYPINPTNPSTFPWLSLIAPLYDQWEPNGIVFEFVSTSSEFNGTSQALGAVIMATDYDTFDAPYVSKQEAENSDFACSTKPSCNLVHGIECAQSERPTRLLYTDTNSANPSTFTTLGNFQVSTQGCSTAGTKLGELWISYDISFYKKQLADATLPLVRYNAFGSQTTAGPNFGTVTTVYSQVGIVRTVVVGVGVTFSFPPALGQGRFLLYIYESGGGFPLALTFVNCAIVQNLPSATFAVLTLDITAPGASFNGGVATTTGSWTVELIQVPDNTGL